MPSFNRRLSTAAGGRRMTRQSVGEMQPAVLFAGEDMKRREIGFWVVQGRGVDMNFIPELVDLVGRVCTAGLASRGRKPGGGSKSAGSALVQLNTSLGTPR